MTTPNYITPEGLEALRSELKRLNQERPEVVKTVAWAASNGDRSENGDYIYGKKRLREIDRRIRFLLKRIEGAQVVAPRETDGVVRFASTVELEYEDGTSKTFQIVGEDESEPSSGKISWKSPIARSLLNQKEGDAITLRTPSGEQEVTLVRVR